EPTVPPNPTAAAPRRSSASAPRPSSPLRQSSRQSSRPSSQPAGSAELAPSRAAAQPQAQAQAQVQLEAKPRERDEPQELRSINPTKLAPIAGRERELAMLADALLRHSPRPPVLVGEHGSG